MYLLERLITILLNPSLRSIIVTEFRSTLLNKPTSSVISSHCSTIIFVERLSVQSEICIGRVDNMQVKWEEDYACELLRV